MRSNESEVIAGTLDMFGGSEEYRGAVLVAALLNTFKKSVASTISIGNKSFDVDIHAVKGNPPFSLHCTFSKSYLYLFDELK